MSHPNPAQVGDWVQVGVDKYRIQATPEEGHVLVDELERALQLGVEHPQAHTLELLLLAHTLGVTAAGAALELPRREYLPLLARVVSAYTNDAPERHL